MPEFAPWISASDWQKDVQEPPRVAPNCPCSTPGPPHLSVQEIDGAVLAACVCVNCGGIMATGYDG